MHLKSYFLEKKVSNYIEFYKKLGKIKVYFSIVFGWWEGRPDQFIEASKNLLAEVFTGEVLLTTASVKDYHYEAMFQLNGDFTNIPVPYWASEEKLKEPIEIKLVAIDILKKSGLKIY